MRRPDGGWIHRGNLVERVRVSAMHQNVGFKLAEGGGLVEGVFSDWALG